jgi:hypothetical protein
LIGVVVSSASASNASGLPLVTALGLADGVGELGALGSASLVLHETAISARLTIVASHGSALMQGVLWVPRVYPDPADRPAARGAPAVAPPTLPGEHRQTCASGGDQPLAEFGVAEQSGETVLDPPQVVGLDRDRRVACHLRQ